MSSRKAATLRLPESCDIAFNEAASVSSRKGETYRVALLDNVKAFNEAASVSSRKAQRPLPPWRIIPRPSMRPRA